MRTLGIYTEAVRNSCAHSIGMDAMFVQGDEAMSLKSGELSIYSGFYFSHPDTVKKKNIET